MQEESDSTLAAVGCPSQEARPTVAADAESSGAPASPLTVEPLAGEPIGAYLAAQRRLRGISVEELAEQTRIPLRSLQRLESGSFDGQVDGFVRGFVRTVGEALGLDPEDCVARTRPEPTETPGDRRGQHLSLRRVFLTVALIVAFGSLLALIQTLAVSPPRSASLALDPLVVRRDPVRSLAEAQGVAGLMQPSTAALPSPQRPWRGEPAGAVESSLSGSAAARDARLPAR
jgi:hypothetical protein